MQNFQSGPTNESTTRERGEYTYIKELFNEAFFLRRIRSMHFSATRVFYRIKTKIFSFEQFKRL